ncbi:HvfC/BufC family peptide modification chaperone [Hyphococcus sp.]|uniref:HvfC/BufC family peptide modification chaperone n=1 Tax=Hyphococcus sp. TaxID=2038636 RepID=UPI00208A5DCB|nr:MAG: DUF2063 domain-containing protein [Marinicaulis sp.]
MTKNDVERDSLIYDVISQAIRSNAPPAVDPNLGRRDLQTAAGMTVYRNNVRAAFLRVLRETFPVVLRLVGEEYFRFLAHEYFRAHPSSDPLVARYGDSFPKFIASVETAVSLPYLPGVARLELAWLSAYHGTDADCLESEQILAQLQSYPNQMVIDLHPATRFVSSKYPVHAIWRHNRDEKSSPLTLSDAGEYVMLKRPAHQVFTETMEEPLWSALLQLNAGKTLGDVLAAALECGHAVSAAEIVQEIAMLNIVTAVRRHV